MMQASKFGQEEEGKPVLSPEGAQDAPRAAGCILWPPEDSS